MMRTIPRALLTVPLRRSLLARLRRAFGPRLPGPFGRSAGAGSHLPRLSCDPPTAGRPRFATYSSCSQPMLLFDCSVTIPGDDPACQDRRQQQRRQTVNRQASLGEGFGSPASLISPPDTVTPDGAYNYIPLDPHCLLPHNPGTSGGGGTRVANLAPADLRKTGRRTTWRSPPSPRAGLLSPARPFALRAEHRGGHGSSGLPAT